MLYFELGVNRSVVFLSYWPLKQVTCHSPIGIVHKRVRLAKTVMFRNIKTSISPQPLNESLRNKD